MTEKQFNDNVDMVHRGLLVPNSAMIECICTNLGIDRTAYDLIGPIEAAYSIRLQRNLLAGMSQVDAEANARLV